MPVFTTFICGNERYEKNQACFEAQSMSKMQLVRILWEN